MHARQKNDFEGSENKECSDFLTPVQGSFTYYVTHCRWVGGLQNITLSMQLEKKYYVKALLEVGGCSKYVSGKTRYVICE